MDIEYLTKEILPTREQEISEGRNLGTSQPIYFVFNSDYHIVSGHSEYSPITNIRGRQVEFGFIDIYKEPELREFKTSAKGMKEPEEVTRFYTDRYIAIFLTSEAAHDYLKYQKHNLSDPYVYVHYTGYANRQMDRLFKTT